MEAEKEELQQALEEAEGSLEAEENKVISTTESFYFLYRKLGPLDLIFPCNLNYTINNCYLPKSSSKTISRQEREKDLKV